MKEWREVPEETKATETPTPCSQSRGHSSSLLPEKALAGRGMGCLGTGASVVAFIR